MKYFLVLTVMLLAGSVQAEAYDFVVDGIYYEIASVKDLTCVVVKGENEYKGDIVIPAQVEYNNRHFKVQEIRSGAFRDCSKLKSVEIPNSVKKIGYKAFSSCTSLTSVGMSNSITKIAERTFEKCRSMRSVKIPNSVIEIGEAAFEKCRSLRSVEIPNSVLKIDKAAFNDCTNLIEVKLPDYLLRIDRSVFSGCRYLTTIKIPYSVTEIGMSAFADCASLSSVDMPNSITKIESGAFSGCSSLTSVEIPNRVTGIASDLFRNCKSLTSISIPVSVVAIGSLSFEGCSALKDVNLSNGLKSISCDAFKDCVSLQSITIPGSVTKLDGGFDVGFDDCNPFQGCHSLNEVHFLYGPDKLEVRCDEWLNGGKGEWPGFFYQLEKLFIDRVFDCKRLHNNEFYPINENIPLPNIRELYIGGHIQTLFIRDKDRCENLEKIRCYSKLPPICGSFSNTQYMNVMVEVPNSSLDLYRSHLTWGNFWNLQGFEPSGVDDLETEEPEKSIIGRFDLNGNPVDDGNKGITVIRFSDGSTKKVIL